MLTKNEPVVGEVQIWAVPRSKYYMNENPTASPFEYQLHTRDPWTTGAVRVCTHEVTLQVPAGINLLAAAVETLEAKIKEAEATFIRTKLELQEQINNLLMLSYSPANPTVEDGVLEGEVEEPGFIEDEDNEIRI